MQLPGSFQVTFGGKIVSLAEFNKNSRPLYSKTKYGNKDI